MKSLYLSSVVLLGLICLLPACEVDKITTTIRYYTPEDYEVLSAKLDLPESPHNYDRFVFEHDNQPNIIGTLGRVLFYDVNLSSDNSVSCASCHKPELAFSDDVAFSKGIQNRSTTRNSLALGVFRSFEDYSEDPVTTLFWDGRVDNLHDQMIQTIGNPNEMGMELSDVVEKIKDIDYYKILSRNTFFGSGINEELILIALESFMNSITASNTQFDEASSKHMFSGSVSEDWNGFNAQENLGKSLFQTNCVSCHGHSLEALTFFEPVIRQANNGLDQVYTDIGAGEFNPSPEFLGVFKTPSLRNIMLTAPYMHDGRFATLEEVINFYSEGIEDHPNLHPNLKANGHARKFHFTENEKDALIKFFGTLTDHTIQHEEKWADPFL